MFIYIYNLYKIFFKNELFGGHLGCHLRYRYHGASKCKITSKSALYIEDIYFFEVINKYISSSVLKTSEFSRVRNLRDGIYLEFTEKKVSFLFILYFLEDLRLIN